MAGTAAKLLLEDRSVQIGFTSPRQHRFGRTVVAALMLGLWLVVSVFALSPNLHHLLHKDSESVTHYCLITQFAKGSLPSDFARVITAVACSRKSGPYSRQVSARFLSSALSRGKKTSVGWLTA